MCYNEDNMPTVAAYKNREFELLDILQKITISNVSNCYKHVKNFKAVVSSSGSSTKYYQIY